jgi:hypothetical protein
MAGGAINFVSVKTQASLDMQKQLLSQKKTRGTKHCYTILIPRQVL